MFVLEGPDGSGKSTLANELSGLLGIDIFHPGPAPDKDLLWASVDMCMHQLEVGNVCDRINPFSEWVYGPIINDRCLVTWEDVLRVFNKIMENGWLVVYCRPTGIENYNAEEEEYDTEENTAKLRENHGKIVAAYDELFLSDAGKLLQDSFNLFVYDYTKGDAELKRLFDFVKERKKINAA